jgi:hypothetical protein
VAFNFIKGVMDDPKLHVNGAPEEWLRRIASNSSPLLAVPDRIAAALIAIGFVVRHADGSLKASAAGVAHLDTQGMRPTTRRTRWP